MSKIPVYFMPGLAASSSIFERIKLAESVFEMVFLEWEIPLKKESLSDYARRIAKNITHPNPVLIGVSFGGILVQEISKHVKTRKVIIISSVRSNTEFPRRMKIGKSTKAYKLIPMRLLLNLENLAKFTFGEKMKKRIQLYEKFLSVRDLYYLEWAMESIILWDRVEIDEEVVHIHGDQDDVFPIKYIKKCIVVKGATHILILSKYKWLNENLPALILD